MATKVHTELVGFVTAVHTEEVGLVMSVHPEMMEVVVEMVVLVRANNRPIGSPPEKAKDVTEDSVGLAIGVHGIC